jgi:hypothetical protein
MTVNRSQHKPRYLTAAFGQASSQDSADITHDTDQRLGRLVADIQKWSKPMNAAAKIGNNFILRILHFDLKGPKEGPRNEEFSSK